MELTHRRALWALPCAAALALFVVWPSQALAAPEPVDAVVRVVVESAKSWIPTMQGYARGLFLGLAVIQLAYIGIRQVLVGGSELAGGIGAIVLEMVALGFFAVLITQGPRWAEDIILSLQEVGRIAAGGSSDGVKPQQILDEVAELCVKVLDDLSLLNGVQSGLAVFCGAVGLLCLVILIAGLMLVGWAQAWIVVGAGTILLGLGGCSWTRPIATSYLRHALGAGVKLMVLELLSGVVLGHVRSWVSEANGGVDFGLELLVHMLLSLGVLAVMIVSVPSYVSSIVTGSVTNGGEAFLARAAAAAAMFGMGKAAGAKAAAGGAGQKASGALAAAQSSSAAPGLVGAGLPSASSAGAPSSRAAGAPPAAVTARVRAGAGRSGGGAEGAVAASDGGGTSGAGGAALSMGAPGDASHGLADARAPGAGGASAQVSAGNAPASRPAAPAVAHGGAGQRAARASQRDGDAARSATPSAQDAGRERSGDDGSDVQGTSSPFAGTSAGVAPVGAAAGAEGGAVGASSGSGGARGASLAGVTGKSTSSQDAAALGASAAGSPGLAAGGSGGAGGGAQPSSAQSGGSASAGGGGGGSGGGGAGRVSAGPVRVSGVRGAVNVRGSSSGASPGDAREEAPSPVPGVAGSAAPAAGAPASSRPSAKRAAPEPERRAPSRAPTRLEMALNDSGEAGDE